MLGQSECLDCLPRPVSFLCIEKFGCGSNAILVCCITCEEVTEEVGHEEKAVSRLQLCRALDAEQLCQSINLHHLNTCSCIMLGGREGLEEFLCHAGGACIAVANGVAYELSVAVNQSEVHSPCVHADALNLIALGCGFLQTGLHVLEQGREVPVDMLA